MKRFKNARACIDGACNPRPIANAPVEAIDEVRAEGGDPAKDEAIVLILDQLNQVLEFNSAAKFSKAFDKLLEVEAKSA